MSPKIIAAWKLAERGHRNQKYGSEIPYLYHIGQVYLTSMMICKVEMNLDVEFTGICAILHDLIEDTEISELEIKEQFGEGVLTGVLALTKNENIKDKKQQMIDSLNRIKECRDEVGIVKLSDRVSNLTRKPPLWWDKFRVRAYVEESKLIHEELKSISIYGSKLLLNQMSEYENHDY